MYAKTIEVTTQADLLKLIGYLESQNHPHHGPKGYQVGKMASAHPDLTAQNFPALAAQTAAEINVTKRGGAPIKNIATLHIIRTPYATYLAPRERAYLVRRYLRDVVPDGLAIWNEHLNPLHGSDDFNILVLNTTSLIAPRTRRQQGIRPHVEARRMADRITDKLNTRRRVLGKLHIDTMPEVQRAAATKRRGENLEAELAALPADITLENLRGHIEALGHEVRRYSPEKNYLSIRFKGAKPLDEIVDEKRRKKSIRGMRFDLVELLTNVWQLRMQKRRAKVTQAKNELASFQLPKDSEILRILERRKRPPMPPSPEPPAPPKRSQ